jgi:hypothetical protein
MAELSPEERGRVEERLRFLARLMDAQFVVPGTRWRFGFDSLLGLVPGIGDVGTALISLYIIAEAQRLGVPRRVLRRMAANVLVDVVIGTIPLAGDVFDAMFKANLRNLRLMGISPESPRPRKVVRNEAEDQG